MLSTFVVVFLFCYITNVVCINDVDPKYSVRLNEIHLNVAYVGNKASFLFVEVYSPLGVIDLTGSTVVFYSSSSKSSFAYCSCDKVKTNNLGYGSCNCGLGGITTSSSVGAVVFHNVPYASFQNPISAEQALNLNLTDVVLYQFYGAPIDNALQSIFAPGQVFHYPPPVAKSAYSIVRCYGDAETNAKWQAAFTWIYTATQNGPNICPVPTIYVNELHFNRSYIEIASSSPELPLDAATLAIIVGNGTSSAIVTDSFALNNQRMESTGLLTIGMVPGADILTKLILPIIEPAVIAVYFNITVSKNVLAPTTNITSALIYSTTATLNTTVPLNLQTFGNRIYAVDLSGICSLSVCKNTTDIRPATPSPTSPNNCTIGCSLTNNAKATVRLSELHSNVAWAGSQVTFTFVEVYTPLGSVDLTGLTVVFYFPEDAVSNFTSWNCCSCDGIRTNDQGYALCNCGPKGIQRVPADVAYQGAIALQLVDSSYFANSVSASVGYQLNVLDSIVYQSYGPVDDTNPMKKLFAPGQHNVIAPPLTQSAFSINRCYGNPLTTGTWQASFISVYTASPNAPNPCPSPHIYIDEIHFKPDFIELVAFPGELPLDQTTIAFVSEDGIISSAFPLTDQKADYTTYFSIGSYMGVDLNENLNMPTNGSNAIVIYFNTTVVENATASTSNFLSSLIYSKSSVIVPSALLPFGNESFIIDTSGQCSLADCQLNSMNFQMVVPSLNTAINCTMDVCEPE